MQNGLFVREQGDSGKSRATYTTELDDFEDAFLYGFSLGAA